MASTNDTYDFAADCGSFNHSAYLTMDQLEFLGNPTSVQDIPNGTIYGSVACFQHSVLGMHQLITEAKLWNRLEENEIEHTIGGPKLEYSGHSGVTFYFTWRQMRYISEHGWEEWVKKWEQEIVELEEEKEKTREECVKEQMAPLVPSKRPIDEVEPPIPHGRVRQIQQEAKVLRRDVEPSIINLGTLRVSVGGPGGPPIDD